MPQVRVTRENIRRTNEFIALLENATLANSGLSDKQLERIKNPPQDDFVFDSKDTELSIKLFLACGNASQETFNAVIDAIKDHSPHMELLSYARVRGFTCSMYAAHSSLPG